MNKNLFIYVCFSFLVFFTTIYADYTGRGEFEFMYNELNQKIGVHVFNEGQWDAYFYWEDGINWAYQVHFEQHIGDACNVQYDPEAGGWEIVSVTFYD